MKTVDILSVGLRVIGIYGLLKGIQNVAMVSASSAVYRTQFPDDNSYYFVAGGFIIAYFIASFVLILFPVKIARILMSAETGLSSEAALKSREFQAVALSILGVYVVAYSLPMVLQNSAFAWQAFTMPEYYSDTAGREHVIYALARALELIIGLYLCLQSEGLVNLMYKLRGLGLK